MTNFFRKFFLRQGEKTQDSGREYQQEIYNVFKKIVNYAVLNPLYFHAQIV